MSLDYLNKENGSAPEQEKLDMLVNGFMKLDESRKGQIWELTRVLAVIHKGNALNTCSSLVHSPRNKGVLA